MEADEEREEEKFINLRGPSSPDGRLSIDDVISYIGFGPFQVVAFLLAGIATFAFMLDAALFGFIAESLEQAWHIGPVRFAVLPSVLGVANIIGGFFYGYLSDAYGRVWPFALCSFNIAVFSLASAFSPNFYTFVILRFGTSVGITAMMGLLYPMLVEFLPVKNRGKALIALFIIQALTSCLTGGMAWWLVPAYPKHGWRYLTIATSMPAFITVVYRLLFYYESPRFLITKGRYKKARRILAIMAKWNRKDLDDFIPSDKLFNDIMYAEFEQEKKKTRTLFETLRNMKHIFSKKYIRTTISLIIINVTCAGALWGASLFLPSLLSTMISNNYFIAFMGYLGQIPGILLMLIIVEWRNVGRLNSLRFFTILAIASYMLFGLIQNDVATPVLTILIFFSVIPLSALVNAYSSESYPTAFRSMAMNLFINVGAFFNIFTPFLGGASLEFFKHRPWMFSLIWSIFYIVQLITSFFLTREPLGMRLQDTA